MWPFKKKTKLDPFSIIPPCNKTLVEEFQEMEVKVGKVDVILCCQDGTEIPVTLTGDVSPYYQIRLWAIMGSDNRVRFEHEIPREMDHLYFHTRFEIYPIINNYNITVKVGSDGPSIDYIGRYDLLSESNLKHHNFVTKHITSLFLNYFPIGYVFQMPYYTEQVESTLENFQKKYLSSSSPYIQESPKTYHRVSSIRVIKEDLNYFKQIELPTYKITVKDNEK